MDVKHSGKHSSHNNIVVYISYQVLVRRIAYGQNLQGTK
jgi:hypothetical protein